MKVSPGGGVRPSTVIGPHAIIWLSGSDETPPAARDTGKLAEPLPELAIGLRGRRAVGVLTTGHRQLEREDVRGVEAWRHALDRDEAANQQAGADQQHDRERKLGDDQQAAQVLRRVPRPRHCRRTPGRRPSGAWRSRRLARSAGADRREAPTGPTAPSVKSSTCPSMRDLVQPRDAPGAERADAGQAPRTPKPAPSAPPASASSTLSVRNCRTMRARLGAERRADGDFALPRPARARAAGSRRSRTRSAARSRPRRSGRSSERRTSPTTCSRSGHDAERQAAVGRIDVGMLARAAAP